MAWIAEVHESAADGRLKECYERIIKALGRMIPFYRVFTPSPRLLGAHLDFYGALGGPGVWLLVGAVVLGLIFMRRR